MLFRSWIETTLLEEKGASSTLSEARARLACLGVYIDFLIQEKSSGESSLKKTLDKKFNKAVSAFLSYISIKAERCYLHNKENTQSDERRLDLSLAELHTDFERLTRYLDRFSGFDESKLPSSIKRANLKKRFEDMVYNFQVSEGRLGEFTGQAVRLKEKYERYILPTEKKGKKGTCIASCLPEATTLEELPNYYTVPFRLLSHISKNIQHVSHGKIVEAFCSRLVHDYLSAVLGCLKHEATIKNKGAVLGILGTGKGPNLLTVLDRNLPDKIRDYVIDSILKQLRSVFSEIGLKEKRGDRKNEGKDSMLYTMTENSMEVDQTLFEVSEDTCIEFVTQDSKSKLLLTHSESIEDGGLFLSCQVGPGWNRYIDEALTKHSSIMKKTFQNNGLNLKLDGLVGVDDVQRNALIWRVMNA